MGYGESTTPEIERIATAILDACFKIHSKLGPGLLESAYAACLAHELRMRGFMVDREAPIPVIYEGIRLEYGFRIDLLVNDLVLVELKAVETMHPVFEAQVITYLKLTGKKLGLLINFNVPLIKNGIKRIVL